MMFVFSEIQLTISIGYKSLDISISLPLQYRNLTKGLLGNFNGVKEDDFVLPSGTSLNSDLTDRQIYVDFGPACKSKASDCTNMHTFVAVKTNVVFDYSIVILDSVLLLLFMLVFL